MVLRRLSCHVFFQCLPVRIVWHHFDNPKIGMSWDRDLGSISSTCLCAAFTRVNAQALNFFFTNNTMPNFTSSVSQQLGCDPLLGCQNLSFSTIIVIYGSPNCVIFCIVGRQLPNVENHCSMQCASKIRVNLLTQKLLIERWWIFHRISATSASVVHRGHVPKVTMGHLLKQTFVSKS